MSERASEQMSEHSGVRERSEQCGTSERVSGASERGNGRASGPVLTTRFLAVPNHCASTAEKEKIGEPGRELVKNVIVRGRKIFPMILLPCVLNALREFFFSLSFSNAGCNVCLLFS